PEPAPEPPADADGDGIPDPEDRCIDEPEDRDGFEDEDGCPDPDNDGDGIPDGLDQAPNEAEVWNGYQDTDGKPDEAPKTILVTENRILPRKPILFETNSAKVREESFEILDEIYRVLVENPNLSLQIDGHTDNVGNPEANRRLSEERARAVMQYLIDKGIDPARLSAAGYGASRPVAPNTTPEGRAANRRVDFFLIPAKETTGE
ncbi:MAG: OmpA family protein, partial [Deltaproteobacteria bacterium]